LRQISLMRPVLFLSFCILFCFSAFAQNKITYASYILAGSGHSVDGSNSNFGANAGVKGQYNIDFFYINVGIGGVFLQDNLEQYNFFGGTTESTYKKNFFIEVPLGVGFNLRDKAIPKFTFQFGCDIPILMNISTSKAGFEISPNVSLLFETKKKSYVGLNLKGITSPDKNLPQFFGVGLIYISH